jgi:hypothetical protein
VSDDPIKAYLRAQFPGTKIERHPVRLQDTHEYLVLSETGDVRHRVDVTNDFIEDRSPEEITSLLTEWGLAARLKSARQVRLRVTSRGVHTE